MSAASFTPTRFPFPLGRDLHDDKIGILGTIAIGAGTYSAGGVPVGTPLTDVYTSGTPIWGMIQGSSGYRYQFNPSTGAVRIFGAGSPTPAVTTAAFAIQAAGFGATGSVSAISAGSNQNAFSVSVTASGGTYGTNPTIIYTFPQAFTKAPLVVVCRGNDAAIASNAGRWVVVDSATTTTSCTFALVGTAAAGTYVLDAIVVDVGTNPSAPVVAGSFALSTGWGTSAAPTITATVPGSTQNAFSLTCTAGSAATGANPTVTLTFPVAYATAPVFAVSDGIIEPTAGYWVFTSSTVTTATFTWIGTPTATDVYVLDAVAVNPTVPAITAAMFTPSSGFGTSPVVAVTGTQSAFQMTITAKATTTANPTVSLALPATLVQVPTYVACRGDSAVTAGFWAPVDASDTTAAAVFKYVGTPSANLSYTLNVISQVPPGGYSELAVGGTIPPAVLSDVLYFYVLETLN